ncbi:hypothetical protein BDR22DRAFT_854063 [Usnea florida]
MRMIPPILPLVFHSFVKRIAPQTTSLTPVFTPYPPTSTPTLEGSQQCDGCTIAPATTETTIYNATASRQESFLLFTAYNIGSQYLSNGICTFTLGEFVTVSPVFSVSQPTTFNTTEFLSTATDSFTDHIGFASCEEPGEVVTVAPATVTATPTASIPSLLTSVKSNLTQPNPTGTTTPNGTSTQPVPTQSSRSHDKTVKVANAVAFSIAFLALALLAFFVYKRRKAQKTSKEESEDGSPQNHGSPHHEDTEPYLQQKAELEAEETRKHELEARERRFEMGSDGERYELPAGERDSMKRTMQELRGEEHSTELEASHI